MKRSSRRWKKKGQMRWKWQRKRMRKEKKKRHQCTPLIHATIVLNVSPAFFSMPKIQSKSPILRRYVGSPCVSIPGIYDGAVETPNTWGMKITFLRNNEVIPIK